MKEALYVPMWKAFQKILCIEKKQGLEQNIFCVWKIGINIYVHIPNIHRKKL